MEQPLEHLISRRREAASLLKNLPIERPAFQAWQHTTRQILIMVFGHGSDNVSAVMDIADLNDPGIGATTIEQRRYFVQTLRDQQLMLASCINIFKAGGVEMPDSDAISEETHIIGNKVFLVHGHDDAVRETVARFLERLGLEVVILREQANEGRTIIEKFVDYSDVAFSVVLLTADDRGGTKDLTPESLKPRARQNVILELGFFLGKLGRRNVCALYEDGVEVPSDYQGVLFIPLDSANAWRIPLAKEMRAAGLEVDLNEVL